MIYYTTKRSSDIVLHTASVVILPPPQKYAILLSRKSFTTMKQFHNTETIPAPCSLVFAVGPGGVTFWVTPSFFCRLAWVACCAWVVWVVWMVWRQGGFCGVWCGWWGALAGVPLRVIFRILVGGDGSVCSPFPFLLFPWRVCFLRVLGVVSYTCCG